MLSSTPSARHPADRTTSRRGQAVHSARSRALAEGRGGCRSAARAAQRGPVTGRLAEPGTPRVHDIPTTARHPDAAKPFTRREAVHSRKEEGDAAARRGAWRSAARRSHGQGASRNPPRGTRQTASAPLTAGRTTSRRGEPVHSARSRPFAEEGGECLERAAVRPARGPRRAAHGASGRGQARRVRARVSATRRDPGATPARATGAGGRGRRGRSRRATAARRPRRRPAHRCGGRR